MSPVLRGGFFTTEPPGKPRIILFEFIIIKEMKGLLNMPIGHYVLLLQFVCFPCEVQGGLACYSQWGHKESDMTEGLNNKKDVISSKSFPGASVSF